MNAAAIDHARTVRERLDEAAALVAELQAQHDRQAEEIGRLVLVAHAADGLLRALDAAQVATGGAAVLRSRLAALRGGG